MNFILLQAAPAGGSSWSMPIMMIGMILVFYLFMIRPQAKKAKMQKNFLNELQKGDKVVTGAGIHGTISKVNDDGTLNIETSPGSYMKVERAAINMDWTSQAQKAANALHTGINSSNSNSSSNNNTKNS